MFAGGSYALVALLLVGLNVRVGLHWGLVEVVERCFLAG